MSRQPQLHRMKAETQYFLRVCAGQKTFEIRIDDRNIQTGDYVQLLEWTPETGYTGAASRHLHISYVLRDIPQYGLEPGHCIFCWDN